MYVLDNVEETRCMCCTKHVPNNLKVVLVTVGEEAVYLCPTSFYNLESLQVEYRKHKGTPPGSVRKHYSEYVQGLAKRLETC